jgi:hypothetical protein
VGFMILCGNELIQISSLIIDVRFMSFPEEKRISGHFIMMSHITGSKNPLVDNSVQFKPALSHEDWNMTTALIRRSRMCEIKNCYNRIISLCNLSTNFAFELCLG